MKGKVVEVENVQYPVAASTLRCCNCGRYLMTYVLIWGWCRIPCCKCKHITTVAVMPEDELGLPVGNNLSPVVPTQDAEALGAALLEAEEAESP